MNATTLLQTATNGSARPTTDLSKTQVIGATNAPNLTMSDSRSVQATSTRETASKLARPSRRPTMTRGFGGSQAFGQMARAADHRAATELDPMGLEALDQIQNETLLRATPNELPNLMIEVPEAEMTNQPRPGYKEIDIRLGNLTGEKQSASLNPNSPLELAIRNMLILSRKKDESIVIGDNIRISIVEIRDDKVRLGIDAPRDVSVHRREVYDANKRKEAEDAERPDTTDETDLAS